MQVAAIYKDSSIGNLINIVIVKLVVIHNEQVRNRPEVSNLNCGQLLVTIHIDHKIVIRKEMFLKFTFKNFI